MQRQHEPDYGAQDGPDDWRVAESVQEAQHLLVPGRQPRGPVFAVLVRPALGAVPIAHDGVGEERGGFVGEETVIAAAVAALLRVVAFLASRSGAVSALLCFV